MKANELRINNYLYNDRVVVKIDARTIFDIWDNKGLKNYKPIPLTEEWLLKFGFEESSLGLNADGYEREPKINRRRSIGLYEWDEMWFVTFREDIGIDHVDLNEIEHVHQLQNLYFALTNEELELKNP